jgi:hypothetical protein
LNVKIGDDDELGTFIFRTTGYNSIRSLAARLSYYQAVSGNLLSCLPLQLRIRGKSTTQSHRSAIYYVDVTVREGSSLEQSIIEAKALDEQRKSSGYDQEALDQASRLGFANAVFEFGEDEIPEVLEEFFPEGDEETASHQRNDAGTAASITRPSITSGNTKPSLKEKLERKVPVLLSLHEWLSKQVRTIAPNSGMAKALAHALKRWPSLVVYAQSGDIPIDNNPVENCIRPIALGKKNWLFAGSERAGCRAAAIQSLLATAKLNG